MQDQLKDVGDFLEGVVALPIPPRPTRLSPERREWFLAALREEFLEFRSSENLEDDVDACVDLAYFAIGRLFEMGVDPWAAWDEVHRANMRKRRGQLAKRPGSLGHDAVKPDGWVGPDHAKHIAASNREADVPPPLRPAPRRAVGIDASKPPLTDIIRPHRLIPWPGVRSCPKIVVIGHGRHGKDTVAEMLRDWYGLSFTSSSLFCAERVMMPAFRTARLRAVDEVPEPFKEDVRSAHRTYANAADCYHDRHQSSAVGDHRTFWFEEIAKYCADPVRLGREILADHDVYCGIRSRREFHAVKNARLADLIIWVDASDRLPLEQRSSMELEPWMADVVLDNNGTLEDLGRQLEILMEGRF